MEAGITNDFFNLVIVPLLIVVARIADVGIGTIRIILVGKGYRLYSSMLGFVEILIWITATGYIMQNLDSVWNYLAYATGFSLGTYFGVVLEGKISIGKVMVRIITHRDNTILIEQLHERDYSFTTADAEGRYGKVKIIFMAMKRRAIPKLVELINEYHPKAFYTIEDVRYINDNIRDGSYSPSSLNLLKGFSLKRK